MLKRVLRPDGEAVVFTYDALGRRLAKSYRGQLTRWVWDGNVPLHEWQEQLPRPEDPATLELTTTVNGELATWLFEPDTFAPLAKFTPHNRYGIVTDHLGTPVNMYTAEGKKVWSLELSIYGEVRSLDGWKGVCPFRYPGQYHDDETGLYYNRFRYYDPEAGAYLSVDPIGLAGGNPTLYGYVGDVNGAVDVFGLNTLPSLPNKSLAEAGNTRIVHYYENLELEHADPIHFHVETNERSVAKVKADGTLLDGKLDRRARSLIEDSKNKLRKAEKRIANYIREVGGGVVGNRPFREGGRGCPKKNS